MSPKRAKYLRMLFWIFAAYGLLLLAGCALQRKMLYFPQRLPVEAAQREAAESGFQSWNDASGRLIGWKMPGPPTANGTVLILHGNAGWAGQRNYIAQPIRETGLFHVHVMEYPGYGSRQGSPSLASWLAAVEHAVEHLPTNHPIYLVSESIGAGPATHAAKTFPSKVAGMTLFAPFDTLARVAQSHMPLLLPQLILRDRYNPTRWLQDYKGPVVFVLAENDTIIPPRFGRKLHDDYQGPKKLEVIPGTGHNDIAYQSPEWWRKVEAFWSEQHGR